MITLSVVSHGHGALLQNLLRDLARQTAIDECLVIVTLNLADEPFDAEAHAGMRLHVIRNATPKGFGTNHNTAFAHAIGKWFVVLNPDIRLPDSQTLALLTRGTDDGEPRPALRAPIVLNSSGKREDSVRANLTPWSLLRRALGYDRTPVVPRRPARKGTPFYWFAGMLFAVRNEVFASLDGFDPRFFLYCEDYDLCARLYGSGHELLLDEEVSVVHDAQRDSHRSARHLQWHLQSLLKVWTSRAFWEITLFAPAETVAPGSQAT